MMGRTENNKTSITVVVVHDPIPQPLDIFRVTQITRNDADAKLGMQGTTFRHHLFQLRLFAGRQEEGTGTTLTLGQGQGKTPAESSRSTGNQHVGVSKSSLCWGVDGGMYARRRRMSSWEDASGNIGDVAFGSPEICVDGEM